MTWFKNLRTMAKLMLGFTLMAALLAFVGYTGISDTGEINERLATLYQRDMRGLYAMQEVAVVVASIGRQTRGAVIYTDMASMQKEKDKVEALFVRLDGAMATAEGTFVTDRGKALITDLKQSVPEYRSICSETIRVSMTNDKKAALDVLSRAIPVGDRINAAVKAAVEMKQAFGQQAFEESAKTYSHSRWLMTVILTGAIVLALALGYFIASLISTPLARTVTVLEAVAAGDLTQSLEVSTKDEIGQMAGALNAAVRGMKSALTEVRSSADSVAAASQQLAASSEEMASGTQEQASSLEETSASLEEITSSVKQNADNARQANQLAAAARDTAEKGGQVVSSAVTAMGEINTASTRIAEIISAIDEIAFQTNLLALNAAVEAARAGEQGRGFAVVASEVRSLAQRSATAAKEIKALIQDSVRKVEAGSVMVNQSGEVLVEIVASVKRVTDIVGEIAAASREQSTGIQQVGLAMSQVDQVTQQGAAQTEELSATAQSLSAGAEQLQSLVTRFRLDDGPTTLAVKRPAIHAASHKPARPASVGKGLRALSRHVQPAKPAPAAPTAAEPVEAAADPGSGFMEF